MRLQRLSQRYQPNQRGERSSRRATGKEELNTCAITNENRLEARDERESNNGDEIPCVKNESLSTTAHENQTGDALIDGPVSSPSKRTRRFEKAIKMRDMRKNKIEAKNTCNDAVSSQKKLQNEVASANNGNCQDLLFWQLVGHPLVRTKKSRAVLR